jgi:hypothetical protein
MTKKKPKESSRVECAFDQMVTTEALIPNPRNPNKHPKKQVELLAKIIKAQGWRNPIVVSNRSGFIVKGHARLEAAKLLGCVECPVDFQDYATEADEWADMIADNRLAELAEPDLPMLKDILQELDTGVFDMDLTGFDTESIESLMTQLHEPEEDNPYISKIISPIYQPKGEKPPISTLYDEKKTQQLISEIDNAHIPEEIAVFLRIAAQRHTVFNFRQIAEYYCHADAKTQELIEKSGLIIIDFKKAIEYGFVHLVESLQQLVEQEESDEG